MQAAEPESPAGDDESEAIDLRMPAWLVSALFHVLVVLALPLFDLPPFAHDRPTQLEVSTASAVDAQLGEIPITQVVLSLTLPDAPVGSLAEQFAAKPPVPTAGGMSIENPVLHTEVDMPGTTVVCELPGKEVIDVVGPNEFDPAGTRDIIAARTDLMLQIADQRVTQVPLLRPEDMKQSVASGPENEAIAKALRWIVSRQENRAWSSRRHSLAGDLSMRVGETSLALLPLLAMGQTHRSGKYQTQVQAAIDYLLDGADEKVDRTAEAMRAVTLCELFLATRDPKLRNAAENAVQQVIQTNYRPLTERYGLRVISGTPQPRPRDPAPRYWAWQVWAVYAGQLAGLQENTNVLPTLNQHCHLGEADPLVGCAYSLYDLEDSALVSAANKIAAAGPATQGERRRETDYYATLLLARMQHPQAKQFQQKLSDHLLDEQLKAGPNVGSWQPEHAADEPLTTTIFSALILAAPSETTAIHKPRTSVP